MNKSNNTSDIYMKYALNEARRAFDIGEVPVGAVIVAGDRIVAAAHNLTERLCDPTAHAEMQAITAAASALGGKYLKGCTMYVTVEPCPMCAAALYWSQIDKVVYGASDEKMGYARFGQNLLHPRTVVETGVMGGECAELMHSFFQKLRESDFR